jgi:hypothetical protein
MNQAKISAQRIYCNSKGKTEWVVVVVSQQGSNAQFKRLVHTFNSMIFFSTGYGFETVC